MIVGILREIKIAEKRVSMTAAISPMKMTTLSGSLFLKGPYVPDKTVFLAVCG